MRLICRHGHYAFYPQDAGDLFEFQEAYKIKLVRVNDYYTFQALSALPDYVLATTVYGNALAPAIATIEGKPWDIMKANNLVYNLATGLLVLKTSIISNVKLPFLGKYFIPEYRSLILQSGSRVVGQSQILSYDSEFATSVLEQRITGVWYD